MVWPGLKESALTIKTTTTAPKPKLACNSGSIQTAICEEFDVTVFDISNGSREMKYSQLRFCYYFLMRRLIGDNMRIISRSLPLNQHRTTILNAIQMAQDAVDIKSPFGLKVINILSKFE